MKIQIKTTQDIKSPVYQTQGSAGLDLVAAHLDSPLTLNPNECVLIGTGISMFIENPNFAGMILPRSGLGHVQGLILGNSVGLIDSDYQGEIKVSLWNRSDVARTINPLDRIAQLVIVPVIQAEFEQVSYFTNCTDRGDSGFGSTGLT